MSLRFDRVETEVLEMEATYNGDGAMPPMHLHPSQTERFEVIEGSMKTNIGNEERVYEAGDPFDVPAGTPHQMAAEGPTRMRWEVRPAMRTAEFFERLYGEGPGSAREMGESFFADFTDEFRLA